MEHKFNVGDIVVGNELASCYGITGTGSVGLVVSIDPENDDWSCGGEIDDTLDCSAKEEIWDCFMYDEDCTEHHDKGFIIRLFEDDDPNGDLCDDCFSVSERRFNYIGTIFGRFDVDLESDGNIGDFISEF